MAIEQEIQGLGLSDEAPAPEMSEDEAGFEKRRQKAMMSRAIPGQGLMTDPDNPPPWERPPKYTDYDEAVQYVFEDVNDKSEPVLNLISSGVPLEKVTEMYLTEGFGSGKWEPHLMMLLIEPTMYCIMFICEVAGVEYEFVEEELQTDTRTQMKMEKTLFGQNVDKMSGKIATDVESKGVMGAAQDVIPPSLLAMKEGI